jgi:hypothetical protein
MIPNHVLDGLGPSDHVAVLSRNGELHFLVHDASASREQIVAEARRSGSDVLATHLHDKQAILEFVGDRERDVGGEG